MIVWGRPGRTYRAHGIFPFPREIGIHPPRCISHVAAPIGGDANVVVGAGRGDATSLNPSRGTSGRHRACRPDYGSEGGDRLRDLIALRVGGTRGEDRMASSGGGVPEGECERNDDGLESWHRWLLFGRRIKWLSNVGAKHGFDFSWEDCPSSTAWWDGGAVMTLAWLCG